MSARFSRRASACANATAPRRRRIHPAWFVAATALIALIGAAGFRAAPGVLMVPLEAEFGWSLTEISLAVTVNLLLFGLTAPFAAALMQRFGIRLVTTVAAAGSALTVLVAAPWQLMLTWGVLIGLGTGSMALVFAATVTDTWFASRRGLVSGILTAGSATGQLIFLLVIAFAADGFGWRIASLSGFICGNVVQETGGTYTLRGASGSASPTGAADPDGDLEHVIAGLGESIDDREVESIVRERAGMREVPLADVADRFGIELGDERDPTPDT